MRGSTMLYQELPRIESTPLDGWSRWLAPGGVLGAAMTLAILLLLAGQPLFGLASLFAGLAGGVFLYRKPLPDAGPSEPLIVGPDYSLVGAALGLSREPTALTTSEGSLLVVNAAYRDRFGGRCAPL